MYVLKCSILAVKHNTNRFLFATCPEIEEKVLVPLVDCPMKGLMGRLYLSTSKTILTYFDKIE
jgi:hypothetical protein